MKIKNPQTRKLLLAVKRRILQEPHQFQMTSWFSVSDSMGGRPTNCGTAACIAGHVICVGNKNTPQAASWEVGYVKRKAAELLQIKNVAVVGKLFYLTFWPKKFLDAYNKAGTVEAKARSAARRIDHFLATGN